MTTQRTLAIIKPDAVERNIIGKICTMLESNNLNIVAAKMKHLTHGEAAGFYQVHASRPFYNDLVSYMISSPVMILVLEGENAVEVYRNVMGATDPKNAAPNTIRAEFALGIEKNSVHGSDSVDNALMEIGYFFAQTEIIQK
jgi:nucleoside-diphosphate kinase